MASMFASPTPAASTVLPTLPVQSDSDEEERQRRLEALARRKRGRFATIATSSRGLLTSADALPQRKHLLGE